MKENTILIRIALAACIIISLSASAFPAEKGGIPGLPPNPAEKITLRLLTTPWLSPTQPNAEWIGEIAAGLYRERYEAWQKAYSNIIIKEEQAPWDEIGKKLIIMDEAGNPPDVVIVEENFTPEVSAAGRLMPLDEYLPRGKKEDIHPTLGYLLFWKDQLMALPTGTDCRILIYRKDLFDQAGLSYPTANWTWEDQMEVAMKLTYDTQGKHPGDPGFNLDKVKQWGFGFCFGKTVHAPLTIYAPQLWQVGGDLVDKTGKAIFNSLEGVRALNFFVEAVNKYHVSPLAVAGADYPAIEQGLIRGTYAMAQLGSWEYTPANLPSYILGKFSWTEIPTPVDGKDATMSGYWSWAVSAKTKYPRYAYALAAWFTEVEFMSKLALTGNLYNQLPMYKSSMEFLIPGTDMARMAEYELRCAKGFPKLLGGWALWDLMESALGAAVKGTKSPEQALDDAATEYNEKYWVPVEE